MSFIPLTKEDYDIASVFAERMGPDYCVFAFNYRLGFLADNDRSRCYRSTSLLLKRSSFAEQVIRRIDRIHAEEVEEESLRVY